MLWAGFADMGEGDRPFLSGDRRRSVCWGNGRRPSSSFGEKGEDVCS